MNLFLYSRTPGAIFSRVGDEYVALDIEQGACFGLNETASFVWDRIEAPASVAEICTSIAAEFDGAEDCEAEVTELLEQLVTDGLAQKSEVSAAQ